MFNSVNLGNFCSPSRKERGADFGERGSCASNLYLPSCTYYVPEFSTVSSFLPQAPSRQISYPYPAQVPPVREVSYGLEPSGKWHPRNSYSSCYAAADELMHRECLPPSTVTEILMKNEGSYGGHHHPSAPHAAPAGFYSSVNIVRNWRSKGHLAPLMRPTKFPEIPVSLERNTEVFGHPLL